MGLELGYQDCQTPINDDEKDDILIKSITTQGELDEHEQLNIEKAIEWIIHTKFKAEKILTEEFIKSVHRKMFDKVW